MRISFLNIQNLFFRDISLEKGRTQKTSSHWLIEMDQLMEKIKKGKRELQRIEELSLLLGFQRIAKQRYGILRNRGDHLYLREGILNNLEKANTETNWQGWMKITSKPVHHTSIRCKIRLLAELNSDLVILQEVEDKYAVKEFLKKAGEEFPGIFYPNTQVVEGDDPRGVEQALLYRNKSSLKFMSPVVLQGNSVNNRDQVSHYEIEHKEFGPVTIIAVYLSPGPGNREDAESQRRILMTEIANYYRKLCSEGIINIVIMGTFRAPGYCYSLAPLLRETDLKDISTHKTFSFQRDGYSQILRYPVSAVKEVVGKNDFFLLSPSIADKVKASGLIWSGCYWPGKSTFKSYPQITSGEVQASDHPGLWIDI